MSYAEKLPEVIAAYGAEIRQCEAARNAMWKAWAERNRNVDDIGQARPRQKKEAK